MSKRHSLAIPDRKISETLIDFGAPLITELDHLQSMEIVQAVFTIVIMIWNAHVMAMPEWGKPELLKQLQQTLRGPATAPQLIATYQQLTQRRHELFADDPRAVGTWRVERDAGTKIRLFCDARIPPSFEAAATHISRKRSASI